LKREDLHKKLSTIFVCEFITAGGFNHAELPQLLVREGMMMRDALLADLSQLPYQVSTTVDARLAIPKHCHTCTLVQSEDDVWQVWECAMQAADAVWLIAPETNGLLKKLTILALKLQKTIIGCGLESVAVSTSKLATYQVLQKAGISTIPTYTLENWPKSAGTWIAKPDDGAGCDATVCFDNAEALANWININNKAASHVIQPFQAGVAASISCVMQNGKAFILSCNQQIIEINAHQLSYHGSKVNAMYESFSSFELMANKIAQTMPDLAGYVGVDVIVNDDKVIVVEINPRVTTSYCALSKAIGANPAELVINTLMQENYIWPKLEKNVIELYV
jgi:tyramine---L-glutamate ligase